MKTHQRQGSLPVRSLALAAVTGCATASATAQTSVNIFGMIDAGVSYISNKAGTHHWSTSDGINGPNLLGFYGSEDLGGGSSAIFNLTNQFLLYRGSFVGTQSIFTRTAFVGLADKKYGTLTFGNQYDFINDFMYAVGNDPALYSGHLHGQYSGPFQGLALPANSNADGDWFRASGRMAGSAKYLSPDFAGFSAGAMYGTEGPSGGTEWNGSRSYALNYAKGSFGANAAYTYITYPGSGAANTTPTTSVRRWALGARYQVTQDLKVSGMYQSIANVTTGQLIYEATAGASWFVLPLLNIGVSYAYVKGNDALGNKHGNQVAVIPEYFFSKRTSVYAMGVYQRANDGALATITGTGAVSDGPSQLVARIGMRHKF